MAEKSWFLEQHKKLQQKKQGKRSQWAQNTFICLGFGLVAIGLWMVIAIFGPVLIAETGYQLKKVQGYAFSLDFPTMSQTLTSQEIGIAIPSIYVHERVITGVDPADKMAYLNVLQRGVAHAKGTALPGEPGLGYYFAHSSGMNVLSPQKKAAFYLLGKLKTGDDIFVYSPHKTFNYKVTAVQIVEASDITFLQEWGSEERIVLQTCWPVGTSLRRLLVFAVRV